ncbi:MAG: hypothetical protein NXI30_08895 [bacterium]|nr:hypothetical protein [bacterium]
MSESGNAARKLIAVAVLLVLGSPAIAGAQIALITSRATSYTFDVWAGATSTIDRHRVVDAVDGAQNLFVNEAHATEWGNADGWATVDAAMLLAETLTLTSDSYLLEMSRTSTGEAEWIWGVGVAGAQLNNTSTYTFDVIEPVDYVLTVSLSNDPNGIYSGRLIFDDTSPAVPAILNEDTTFGPLALSGTLPAGSYRLNAVMNGLSPALSSNPGPHAGTASYDVTLELMLPEPSAVAMLAPGLLVLVGLARRKAGSPSLVA